ncbi:MAG: dienelactone hydrolase family protein [Propionivibrio sp.]
MLPTDQRTDFDSLVPALPCDRRSFIVTALGAGFALAVQPVMAQTAISTDSYGLVAGEIKVPTADGEMPAYRAQPAVGSNFATILVVQEIFGVHEYIKDTCRRLAKLGYQAIAPEIYARQGDPRQFENIQDLLAKVVSKVPDAQVMSDLDACAAWAKGNGGDAGRLGITGFCWGGRIVWLYAAHNPQVKAGVAWYGRIVGQPSELMPKNPIDVAGQLHGPVLGLYGKEDQGIPQDTLEQMKKALAAADNAASKASQIHVYDNAGHAFHADYRPSYRPAAAEDGWQRMRTWLQQNGL